MFQCKRDVSVDIFFSSPCIEHGKVASRMFFLTCKVVIINYYHFKFGVLGTPFVFLGDVLVTQSLDVAAIVSFIHTEVPAYYGQHLMRTSR